MKKRNVTPKVEIPKPEPTATETIAFARRRIEYYLEHELSRCRETKQKFVTAITGVDLADLDLAYVVRRNAEDIFLAGVTEREILPLMTFYKKSIDSQDGGVQFVLDTLQKEQATAISRLIESPYRHNSTCAISNFNQECELRAKADFWRSAGIGRSTVGHIFHCLREWLAAETEVLDAYRN